MLDVTGGGRSSTTDMLRRYRLKRQLRRLDARRRDLVIHVAAERANRNEAQAECDASIFAHNQEHAAWWRMKTREAAARAKSLMQQVDRIDKEREATIRRLT